MKRRLLDQLAERHSFDVPPSMVDAEYNNIMGQLRHEASHEADPAAALAEIEKDADDYRGIAERHVRLGLLLSEIGAANGIEISNQEMNRLIGQAAAQYQPSDREEVHPIRPERPDGRRPAACTALRGQGCRLPVLKGGHQRACVDPGGTGSRPRERGRPCPWPRLGHDVPAAKAPAKKAAKGKADAKPAKAEAKPAKAEAPAKGKVEEADAKPKPAKPVKDAAPAKAAAKAPAKAEKAPAKKAPAKKK